MRRVVGLLVTCCLQAAACFDAGGPRPRPGTTDPEVPGGGGPAALQWYELVPRVITLGATDTIVLNAAITGTPDAVNVQLRAGRTVPLTRGSGNLYSTKLAAADLLFAYRTGDLHHFAGEIQIDARPAILPTGIVANVRDATVADPTLSSIAPGVQISDHVVNIRVDAVNAGAPVPASVLRTFYNSFADDFEFVAVIEAVRSNNAPFYTGVRNGTTGLGLQLFDNGGTYGSAARLQGIVQYPDDADFDLARTDNLHELAHRWMNYLTHPQLAPGRPHWPLSTLAYGIMGWKDPDSNTWLTFPFDLAPRENGTFLVSATEPPRTFNDLELYLMGLVPPDSVRGHVVFANQNQRSQLRAGGVLVDADSIFIGEIVARDGARSPSAAAAPRTFRIATIVLSRNSLLSRDELAFYEHMAARGELRIGVSFSTGLVRGQSLPFYLATGGRASLATRLRAAAN